MNDKMMQTILLKLMLQEYVKEQLAQGKHEDDYFSFEQALLDDEGGCGLRKNDGCIDVFFIFQFIICFSFVFFFFSVGFFLSYNCGHFFIVGMFHLLIFSFK